MASINQCSELHPRRPANISEGIESRPDCSSREEDIINKYDGATLDSKWWNAGGH
jgi:hypothetical protein